MLDERRRGRRQHQVAESYRGDVSINRGLNQVDPA
jgi:hypothetical protein